MLRRCLLLGAGATTLTDSAGAHCPATPLQVALSPLGRIAWQEGQRPTGVLPSLMEDLQRRSGCALRVELQPRARLLADFLAERGAELIVGAAHPALLERADFLPLLRLRMMLICDRRLVAKAPDSLADLLYRKDWRGLWVRGAAYPGELPQMLERLERLNRGTPVRDWATVLRMLLAGRAEYTLFSPTLLHAETLIMDVEARRRLVARPLSDQPHHEVGVLVAKRLPAELREALRQALQALVHDGTVRRMMLREYPAELLAQDIQFLD